MYSMETKSISCKLCFCNQISQACVPARSFSPHFHWTSRFEDCAKYRTNNNGSNKSFYHKSVKPSHTVLYVFITAKTFPKVVARDWLVVLEFNATLTLSQTSPGFYVSALQVF